MALWKRTRTAAPARTGQTEQVPGYRDLHRIGHGGFSVVYRAHQEQIGRQVALKILAVEFIDGRILRQFLREVQLTARLTGHPNVVTVLDSGLAASGRPYIAMDYYDRGSLKDRLQAEGPLPVRDVLRIGVKIASALEAAHREGMLHRDVKPQNILVSRYGEPALGDFGTARLTAAIDTSASTAGVEALTPVHAAPEVLQGEAVTARSDVYSLGSTLYHLLQGTPAFQRRGDTGIAPLLLRVLTEAPPPFTVQVPAELAEVVLTAMSREQERRFASAGAMALALQGVQAALGMPVTEVPEHAAMYQTPDASAWAPERESGPEAIDELPAAEMVPSALKPDLEPQPDLGPEPAAAIETEPPLAATPWSGSETITGLRVPVTPPTEPRLPRTLPLPPETSIETIATPPPAQPRPRPRSLRTAALAGAAIVAAAGIGAAVLAAGHRTSPPTSQGSSSAPVSNTSSSPSAPADAPVLPPPSNLTTHAVGTTVSLTWTLPPGAADYPIVLDTSPAAGPSMRAIGNGTTSTTVGGLDRAEDYCFKVGILDVIGTASQPSRFSWSAPVCSNG